METRRLAAIREGDLRPHWLDDALRKAGMLATGRRCDGGQRRNSGYRKRPGGAGHGDAAGL
jgi:hypothetical protein